LIETIKFAHGQINIMVEKNKKNKELEGVLKPWIIDDRFTALQVKLNTNIQLLVCEEFIDSDLDISNIDKDCRKLVQIRREQKNKQ